jgi:hypothetical protein
MVASIKNALRSKSVMFSFLLAALFVLAVPAFAQTPVPIEVDTNAIFTSANTWIEVFAPIMAIGIGISIALAILTFIGAQIIKAFSGGRR